MLLRNYAGSQLWPMEASVRQLFSIPRNPFRHIYQIIRGFGGLSQCWLFTPAGAALHIIRLSGGANVDLANRTRRVSARHNIEEPGGSLLKCLDTNYYLKIYRTVNWRNKYNLCMITLFIFIEEPQTCNRNVCWLGWAEIKARRENYGESVKCEVRKDRRSLGISSSQHSINSLRG